METILLCHYCIDAIKSRGEKIFVGGLVERELDLDEEGKWFVSDGLKCEWCEEEYDELYECHF